MTKNSVIDNYDTQKLIKASVLSNSAVKRKSWHTNSIAQIIVDNRIKMLYISAKEFSMLNSYNVKYEKDRPEEDRDAYIKKTVEEYQVIYNRNQIFSAYENIRNLSDLITIKPSQNSFKEKVNNFIKKLNISETLDSINIIFNNKDGNLSLESPSYEFFEQYRKQILDKEFSTKCSFGGLSVHISDVAYDKTKLKTSYLDKDIKDLQRILGM